MLFCCLEVETITANLENLQPVRTKEEAKRRGRNGGIASGKARREKRDMREIARELLSMPLKDEPIEEIQCLAGANNKNMSGMQAALIKQLQMALQGNTQALTFLRDTAGFKPADQVEISGDVQKAADDIEEMIAAHEKELAEKNGES